MKSGYYENLGTVSAENDAVVVGGAILKERARHTFYIVGAADVDAGAVTIEEAPSESFTGTWLAVDTAETVVADTVAVVRVEGVFGALRARVSTAITDDQPAATTAEIVYCGL